MRGGTSRRRLLCSADPLPSPLRPGRGPARTRFARNTRAGLIPARSSRTRAGPRRCSGAARETHRPARGRRASAIEGHQLQRPHSRKSRPDPISGDPLRRGSRGARAGGRGCLASAVRAPAGTRTVPRAGRRIRRARVSERSEFALAAAARAAGPMRVARAEEAPWDTPSCPRLVRHGEVGGFSLGLPGLLPCSSAAARRAGPCSTPGMQRERPGDGRAVRGTGAPSRWRGGSALPAQLPFGVSSLKRPRGV